MTFDIILDLVVILSLIITIAFAIRLNKRLSKLYESRAEMQTFFDQFATSLAKAEINIKELQNVGESVFSKACQELKRAETLREDLAFLNERGDELAEKLDQSIRVVRALKKDIEAQEQQLENSYTLASNNTPEAKPSSLEATSYEAQPELIQKVSGLR